MKMFKKLMAVVLTGAMAVSMLTGCALGDAQKANALKTALNTAKNQGGTKVATYTYKSELNSKAEKIFKDSNLYNGKKDALVDTASSVKTISDNTGSAPATKDIYVYNGNVYAYYVVSISDKTTSSSNWESSAKTLHSFFNSAALSKTQSAKASLTKNASGVPEDGSYYVKSSKDSDTYAKINFGVKFYDYKASGADTQHFAIVVVQLNK